MTEAIEELCPIALSWGVPWDLFWNGEMSAVLSYYEKWKLEEEAYQRKADLNAWLTGVYVQRAVHSIMDKRGEYPQSPFYFQKIQEDKLTEEDLVRRDFAKLDSWRRALTNNFRGNKEGA